MAGAFRLYWGRWCGILWGWPAQPLWRGVRTSTTRLPLARFPRALGQAVPIGARVMRRIESVLAYCHQRWWLPSAFPFMLNSPQQWYALRHRVQAATVSMSDAALTDRVARLQLKWRKLRSTATFDLLQELYAEQHRRAHTS